MAGSRCAICIPVRNEAEHLPGLLGALAAQTDGRQPCHVVLLLNNCTDGSAVLVRDHARRLPALRIHLVERWYEAPQAHVGTARREALEIGRRLLERSGEDLPVLLTTDADATPQPGWLRANLAAIDAGADLVGGLLLPDWNGQEHTPAHRRAARQARYDRLLRQLEDLIDPVAHDPAARHGDHTGASLAIRLDLYARIGGLPALPTREDLALVEAAERHGGRLRHCPRAKVKVSVRVKGRAAGGMAATLERWRSEELRGVPLLVADPAVAEERFRRRRLLRQAAANLDRPRLDRLAAALDTDASMLGRLAATSRNAVEFVTKAGPPRAIAATAEITVATRQLENRIDELQSGRAVGFLRVARTAGAGPWPAFGAVAPLCAEA